MKIAVWHNLPSGGGKRALYYHVRGLVERGHTVECWSLSTADHAYPLPPRVRPEHIIPATPVAASTPRFGRTMLSEYYEAVSRMEAFEADCQRAAARSQRVTLTCSLPTALSPSTCLTSCATSGYQEFFICKNHIDLFTRRIPILPGWKVCVTA